MFDRISVVQREETQKFQKTVLYLASTSRILNTTAHFGARGNIFPTWQGEKGFLQGPYQWRLDMGDPLRLLVLSGQPVLIFVSVKPNQNSTLHSWRDKKRRRLCSVSPSEFVKDCKEHSALIIKLFFFPPQINIYPIKVGAQISMRS